MRRHESDYGRPADGLSIAEAAEALGCGRRKAAEIIATLPHWRIGRRVSIPRVVIEQYLADALVTPAAVG